MWVWVGGQCVDEAATEGKQRTSRLSAHSDPLSLAQQASGCRFRQTGKDECGRETVRLSAKVASARCQASACQLARKFGQLFICTLGVEGCVLRVWPNLGVTFCRPVVVSCPFCPTHVALCMLLFGTRVTDSLEMAAKFDVVLLQWSLLTFRLVLNESTSARQASRSSPCPRPSSHQVHDPQARRQLQDTRVRRRRRIQPCALNVQHAWSRTKLHPCSQGLWSISPPITSGLHIRRSAL